MKTLPGIMLSALILAAASVGIVQAADEAPQYEGIPSYSVTRLKVFEGSVWIRTPDSGEWEEFLNNSPIPERARISVPEDSEAELQFHGGQYMLLTGGTELDLQRLEDGISEFRLRSGEIRFDLPEEDFSPVRVLIPDDARVDISVPGKYWMTFPAHEDPRLIVRAGEATVTTGRGESAVRRGEEARIGRDVRIGPYAGGPMEERREDPGLSDQEKQAGVPPAAATELREYGEWVESSEYGYVWRPRVAPGWTPYYYGRWVWISPYGWTWISSEPWGWYPYHYGYWYTDAVFGWVWYPYRSFVSVNFVFGSYRYPHFHRRAYFVPASVRFVGYGSTVRWVPLRPGERAQRVRYTRADRRLVRWERTLPARTVYVRKEGPRGREWTDWRDVRRERAGVAKTRTPVVRETVKERPPSRQVRPERIPDRGRERNPGRSDPPGSIRRSSEGERSRERSDRSGPSGVTPERGRTREQPEQPPARRMERMEKPKRESRRPPGGWTAPVSRKEIREARPEPAAARPDRSIRESRSPARTESFRQEPRGRGAGGDRSLFMGGGRDSGGGFRRSR